MIIKRLSIFISFFLFFALTGCGAENQTSYNNDMTGTSLYRQQYNLAPSDDYKENVQQRNDRLGNLGMDKRQPTVYGQISSQNTNQPSSKYPHTKAVQIQHAKYAFITVDEKGNEQKITLPDNIAKSLPENVQQMKPEDIAKLLPQDINQLLPKGTEHLTPETIAKLIKQSGVNQATPGQTEQQPAQGEQQVPGNQGTAPAQGEQQTPAKQEQQQQQTAAKAEGLSELEQQVIELTNQERRKNGLSELKADTSLSNVARTKSKDMQANNYFSHTSPTYGSPFDMMRDFGISYNAAAENIAQGQRTAQEVVQSWMNSEGHRANILNGSFTHIGVGHDANGNYWTQMFISK